ncbi:MAG TPA: hypothetical protein VFH61_04170 [Thermoleophilia bacterium]|nr:hypothetical protein [Thermoleophilia bacterium]
MSHLATVTTAIGAVELHHKKGRFTTRRRFLSTTDGREHESRILVDERAARDWYALAGERGLVRRDFPVEKT